MTDILKLSARTSILLTIALLLLGTGLSLAKDDDKTGYEEDDIFYDNRYDYSFELPEEWEVGKTYDDPDDEPSSDRVIVYRKKFRVPVKLQENRGLVQRPTTMILIDSTDLPAPEMFQAIAGAHDLTDFQDAIVSRTVLFQRGTQVRPEIIESLPAEVAGYSAVRWLVRLEYAHQINTQFGPDLVRDYKTGYVYLVPMDGLMMYIEQVCENQSFDTLVEEFDSIINSLEFAGGTDADSTAAEAQGSKESEDESNDK